MSVTTHERPGVYAVYDASTVVNGNQGGKVVGLVALCDEGTADKAVRFVQYSDAVAEFGEFEEMTRLIRLLFVNGAAQVVAVPVTDEDDYEDAFAVLEEIEDVAVMVCDSTDITVQQAMADSITAAAAARRERIGVVCGDYEETVAELVERAADLNDPRMVLVAPCCTQDMGAKVAAAVAGAIAGEPDPAVPLGGAVLLGLVGMAGQFSDTALDALVRGGVTAVEWVSGETSVVRGVTTHTTTDGAADATWRELTTILIVDHVVPLMRDSLRSRFQRRKNTAQTRSAIRAQVVVELERLVRLEIIAGYDNVQVTQLEENPAVCMVEFGFTVTHGLNQIWMSASITV